MKKFELMVLAIVVGMLLFSGANNNVVALCHDDHLQELIAQCGKYVEKSMPKVNPSRDCCNVVRATDFACVCENVTKEILQWVDMDKVVFVAGSCGRHFAHGTKCGGVTVPLPMP